MSQNNDDGSPESDREDSDERIDANFVQPNLQTDPDMYNCKDRADVDDFVIIKAHFDDRGRLVIDGEANEDKQAIIEAHFNNAMSLLERRMIEQDCEAFAGGNWSQ